MAFQLTKISAGVFSAAKGVKVEFSVSPAATSKITGVVYGTQVVTAAPWKITTDSGSKTAFIFLEATVPGARVDLNEVDGASEQKIAFSFFDPTFPQDDIQIQVP